MAFGGFLQANTAVDLIVGPFVDDTDGKTAETGLTITQAEVRLSKNGGNMAQKNEATALSHDELGNYVCKLDTTDTNTEGILSLMIHESGALPIKMDYMVLAQAAYISLITAKDTGYMDINVRAITAATIANASFNADVGSTAYATNIIALAARKVLDELNLDHLMKVAVSNRDTIPEVVDDTVLANLMTKTDGDTSDFDHATDSLEAIKDATGAGGAGSPLVLGAGDVGDFVEDGEVHFFWNTIDRTGESADPSTAGSLRIYKDDGTGEVTAPTGITDTRTFDTVTGLHECKIDLSANSFYEKGKNYSVILVGAVIDTKTVNAKVGSFSIENRWANVDFHYEG